MKALVVCPADRSEVSDLSRKCPLALFPVLGRSLLEVMLTDLAQRGAKEVLVLAADRPEEIRFAVGQGETWGLKVEVIPETRELTADAARAKYCPTGGRGWLAPPHDVVVLDHLPSEPGTLLWADYPTWFEQLRGQIKPTAGHQLGVREVSPGIFVGLRTRVAATALLVAPCWVGEHAWVGAGASIGPGGILEQGAYVDEGATVVESIVGPETYVGVLTELRNSFAWGRGLLNWQTGSFTEVTEEILLADLAGRSRAKSERAWLSRLLALITLGLTWPIVIPAWLGRAAGEPLFLRREAVRTPLTGPDLDLSRTVSYCELNGVKGFLRRWPELWKIVRGEFNWMGNRPLTPDQATCLQGEFERLWLAVPSGLISLADIEGCRATFSDEARAHSSFYAVHPSRHGDIRLVGRMITRAFFAPR